MNSKYVASKNGTIYVVSSSPLIVNDPGSELLEVPEEHHDSPAADVVTRFKVKCGKLRQRRRSGHASKLKLAFVGNWKMQCGIATYSENLLPHVARQFGDFRLFIENAHIHVDRIVAAITGKPVKERITRGFTLPET